MKPRAAVAADEGVRFRYAAAAAFVVTAGAVVLAFPGLPPLDAGDFVTAAATLGVPHATGFPAYIEASRAFAWLPLGNVASRIAWFSALGSGLAAASLVWVVASHLALRHGTAAVAATTAAAFFLVDTLVLHARVAEVYALNLALVGAALVGLERLRATGDPRWRALVALAAGLGLANHALFRLLLPVLVVAAVALAPPAARRRGWSGLIALGALAVLAYAATYAAAAAQPVHNWGDPSSLGRLWAHVTARDIRIAFADEMRPTPFTLATWTGALAAQVFAGLGAHAALGAVGLALCLRRARGSAVVLAAIVLVEWAYATAINPMGIRDHQNGQLVAVALAACAGGAVGAAAERFVGAAARPAVGVAAALVVALGFAGASLPSLGATARDWSAEDVAVVHLGLASPESVTVPGSDTTTAALLYTSVALDGRPDAVVVGRHQVADDGAALLASVPARTVYWEETGSGDELPPSLRLVHAWPIGRVVPVGAADDECAAGSRSMCVSSTDVAWGAGGRSVAGARGWFYRHWMARRWAYRGARAFRAGRPAEAGMWFERAVGLAPDVSTWLTGLAVALANTGRVEEALVLQLAALRRDPLSRRAAENALEFASALGDTAEVDRLGRHLRRLRVDR